MVKPRDGWAISRPQRDRDSWLAADWKGPGHAKRSPLLGAQLDAGGFVGFESFCQRPIHPAHLGADVRAKVDDRVGGSRVGIVRAADSPDAQQRGIADP